MTYITGVLRKNRIGRWCIIDINSREDLKELNSGHIIEILEDGEWKATRIEHFKGDYNSVDGYSLHKDKEVRIKIND